MRIKEGVELDGISTNITKTWHIVEYYLAKYGQEMWITSGLEGIHKQGSKHHSGEAVDLRIWDLEDPDRCVMEMSAILGPDYDVVLESTHIHLEYDPK